MGVKWYRVYRLQEHLGNWVLGSQQNVKLTETRVHRCIAWTNDGRVFFYNQQTKTSVWERPVDLLGRADVEIAITTTPENVKGTQSKNNNDTEVNVKSRKRHRRCRGDQSDVSDKKVKTDFPTTGKNMENSTKLSKESNIFMIFSSIDQ